MSQIFKRFRRDIIGLLWLSIGIFVALSLYSFRPTDPSFNSIGRSLRVQNYCGYFGSFLGDILFQIFGICAWVVVLAAFVAAYKCFSNQSRRLNRYTMLWAALLLITTSSLLSLYWPAEKIFDGQILMGGLVGLAVTNGLIRVFNPVGVGVILWTLVPVLIVFFTEKSLTELMGKPYLGANYLLNKTYEALKAISTQIARLSIGQIVIPLYESLTSQVQKLFRQSPTPYAVVRAGGTLSANRPGPKFFPLDRTDARSGEVNESKDLNSEVDGEELEFAEEEDEFEFDDDEGVESVDAASEPTRRRKVSLKKKVQRQIENWELPKLSLLEDPPFSRTKVDDKEIKHKAHLLTNKLEQFSVRGEVVGVKPGPAVTLFEFKPNVDVKISKITELADDLSLALSSESVRIIAPIPGRDVVGIETSNSVRETVYLKDVLADENFWDENIKLPLALGRRADGDPQVVDLRKMPHLLVAGSTGSGKSVFTVSTLIGLLFRHSPKTLRLILVDPKQVDLAAFNEIPHLLMPPVREPKKAIGALKWAIREMEKRYRSMSKFGVRDLEGFNQIVNDFSKTKVAEHEKINDELEGAAKLDDYYFTEQPYIVIVVEEFGDLMAVDKANVEQAVVRLAQMARACGIHLILAMQSPRKDVVTGLIKTNIPGRISFKVASKMDSRIILDESGAERLLTRGDMLFLAPGVAKPMRHHGPWLTEKEITAITESWREQSEPQYDPLAMRAIEGSGGGYDLGGGHVESEDEIDSEERYDEFLSYVSTLKEVSASLLQRKFRLGYPRAARVIEIFESEGVVGPANGSKPRQVLISELK